MSMQDITPTQSAFQELQAESRAMQEGYRFLDEKRLILAAELVRELEAYKQAKLLFDEQYAPATKALRDAIGRHGLEGLLVYPPVAGEQQRVNIRSRSVLGVECRQASLNSGEIQYPEAVNPSPEAEHCRRLFFDLMPQLVALAAMAGNLERLRSEYSRTARRARALEDVLLPELEQTLKRLDAALEELERDESSLIHWAKGRKGG